GGRLVIESYQSLEDRLVKEAFRAGSTLDVPVDLPIIPESEEPPLKLLTRGAVLADEEERARNPRSASVRLRGVELVRDWKEPS
ncbi:16S rRNA (cytosine(1402)-N(4))-methyltransferase, partial [Schaalia hyovaginalis]